jgi:hypothetical protein
VPETVGVTTTQAPRAINRWWTIRQAPPAIYGTIIGASVMAATEEHTPVGDVAASVVVTLIVYWLAERWSFVLGSHLTGEPITLAHAKHVFAEGFSMVEASYTPLLVMLVAWGLGADADTAVSVALLATVVVLLGLGFVAGRRAGLTGWVLAGSSVFTGMLGILLIVLKSLVQH